MDRYHRLEKIGHGRFSDVYMANDSKNEKTVAIKEVIPIEEAAPHNTKQELLILKMCKNDSIAQLLDHYEYQDCGDEHLAIVMPYYSHNLNQLLESYRKAVWNPDATSSGAPSYKNGLNPLFATNIALQIASGLEYIHKLGVIHRDIKPQNIMFESQIDDPARNVAKIIDFGTAWTPPDNNRSERPDKKVTDVGTTCYRAPEVLFGRGDYGSELDVWSLGCVIAKMFSNDTNDLFGPYRNDICLIGTQFEKLGAPTIETWPEMANVDSFKNMDPSQSINASSSPLTPDQIVPRGGSAIARIVSRCLTFQSTERPDASTIKSELIEVI